MQLRNITNSSVNLVHRQVNQVVHALSMASRFYASSHHFNHLHDCINALFISEMMRYFLVKKGPFILKLSKFGPTLNFLFHKTFKPSFSTQNFNKLNQVTYFKPIMLRTY